MIKKLLCRPSVYTNFLFLIPILLFWMIEEYIIGIAIFLSSFLNFLVVIGCKKRIVIDLNYIVFHAVLMVIASVVLGRIDPAEALCLFCLVVIGVWIQEQSKRVYETYQTITQIVFLMICLFIFFLL